MVPGLSKPDSVSQGWGVCESPWEGQEVPVLCLGS